MGINQSRPIRFTARGTTDSFDSTDKFPGACQKLTNLVFDQANPELVVSRPGVVTLANLIAAGFANPTFISIQIGIGPRIYGMVATTRNAGHDEPFIYDTSINAFVTVTGTISAATTPTSPATTGAWTPPTIATVGTMIIVTHPGFPGTAGKFFGYFDVTTAATPVWHIANTVTTPLPGVPIAVANFNNRAWFAVPAGAGQPVNQLFYTDVLTNPPTITNATQFLVVGDTQSITALSGLPVTTSSSGIIGALSVFKATQIWQISGDTTTQNLAEVPISLTIGTPFPRSVAQCPYGMYFASYGGPYLLDQLGVVRTITNDLKNLEPDINAAFQNAINPSRWAGAYTATMYRICGQTTIRGSGQFVDYWFDEHKRRWTGPHTFTYDCASSIGGSFVLSSANIPGQLIGSDPNQGVSSVYTDLNSLVPFILQSSTFPKQGDEEMKQVAESTIELAATGGSVTYTIDAQNSQGQLMGRVVIVVGLAVWGGSTWGGTTWGASPVWGGGALWGAPPVGSGLLWGQGQAIPVTYPVQWAAALVFDKMQLQITGIASANVGIGTFFARYQKTGYQAWFPGSQTATVGAYNGV